MKKKIVAVFMALAMTFAVVTPAFASGVSSGEQGIIDRMVTIMNSLDFIKNDSSSPVGYYEGQATSALSQVDLSDAAIADFNALLDELATYVTKYGSYADVKADLANLVAKVNNVANKYGINVVINSYTKKGVSATVNGKTVASSKSSVNQTGFGLAQTAAIVAGSAAVLGGAFVVARKKQLFA